MKNELVYEIAFFNLHGDATDEDAVDAAEKLQRDFLSKFNGIMYRELMKGQDGLWFDTVHWQSLGDFRKAAQEVLSDPAAAPLMQLVDFSSMAWFHAFQTRHWAKGRVPQGTGFTELNLFRLVGEGAEEEGLVPATEGGFLDSAEQSQRVIEQQEGFVDREIFKTKDDWWLDLGHWETKQAAESARQFMTKAASAEEPWVMDLMAKIEQPPA